MVRGEREGGQTKRGGRWCGARGAAAKERGAADGAGQEGLRLNKEGRPMWRGEWGFAETKRIGRRGGERGAAPKQRGVPMGRGETTEHGVSGGWRQAARRKL